MTIDYAAVDAIARAACDAGLVLDAASGILIALAERRDSGRMRAASVACAVLACAALVLSVHATGCYGVPAMARLDTVSTSRLLPCAVDDDGSDVYLVEDGGAYEVLTEDGPETYAVDRASIFQDAGEPRVDMVSCFSEPSGRFLYLFEVTGRIGESEPAPYIHIPENSIRFD